jgi:ATP-binding cassette subfamily B protein
LIWHSARGWTIAWAALLIVQGLLPAATVILTRSLVNSLVAVLGAGVAWERIRHTLILAGLIAGIMLLSELLRSASSWVRVAQSEAVRDHIESLVHRKSAAVDLAFYDSPEYYDRLHMARVDASYRPVALLENIGSLAQSGITLVAMVGVLVPYGPWLPGALLISTLPAFFVVLRYHVRQHRWQVRRLSEERRTWYYYWLLTARETAAEIRLFELGPRFQSAYRSVRRALREERLQLAKDQGLAKLGAGFFAILITGAALGWMAWRALQGRATLGDLALFYQAFYQGQGLMRSMLENVGQVYANSLFLGNLFEFLELEQQITSPPQPATAPSPLVEGIRFRQVTFRYPGSERAALRDLDLAIPAGRIVAIVGANGAGKSTLIRLLCRFYDPEAGSIELDGVDVRDLALEELRRQVAVLFQEPVHYAATAGENIGLGDLSAGDAGAIAAAAQAATADQIIDRLPQGYDTLLGKWFAGGTELSVGEWQRVALARALVRQAPIIVLDEPTSAMDPWTEAEWLARLRDVAEGRTVVIITHRVTTAMHADVIYVMHDGQVIESGGHDELLARQGRYAQSWQAQVREGGRAPSVRQTEES